MSLNRVQDAVVIDEIKLNDSQTIIIKKLNKMSYGWVLVEDGIELVKTAGLKRKHQERYEFLTEVAAIRRAHKAGTMSTRLSDDIDAVFTKYGMR